MLVHGIKLQNNLLIVQSTACLCHAEVLLMAHVTLKLVIQQKTILENWTKNK